MLIVTEGGTSGAIEEACAADVSPSADDVALLDTVDVLPTLEDIELVDEAT